MIEATLKAAKGAKAEVAALDAARKNAALCAMADALITNQAAILDANAADMAAAAGTISDVMLDRLRLTGERIARSTPAPTGCASKRSRCPWAWWRSSMSPAPTSPATPRRWR